MDGRWFISSLMLTAEDKMRFETHLKSKVPFVSSKFLSVDDRRISSFFLCVVSPQSSFDVSRDLSHTEHTTLIQVYFNIKSISIQGNL